MHLATVSAASEAAPGVLGFLVVAGMGVVLYFLFRSMTKHLRKIAVDPRKDVAAASGTRPGPLALSGHCGRCECKQDHDSPPSLKRRMRLPRN
jgi:hypothetical protein